MLKKNNNKSNKLSDPPPSLVIIKIHSRLPREGEGEGEKGKREKRLGQRLLSKAPVKGSVKGSCQRLGQRLLSKAPSKARSQCRRKNKTNNPVKVRCVWVKKSKNTKQHVKRLDGLSSHAACEVGGEGSSSHPPARAAAILYVWYSICP